MLLEQIHSPQDLKRLSLEQLPALAEEMRAALLRRAAAHGGHFGPNFGIVECTIAMHYVFDSPRDKFVFDVSHQTYPHKMLTGRAFAWLDPAHYDDVSGYSEPAESPHDHFVIGHTSTSVSLALGLAHARDLMHGDENIVAVIGDGSLSGGEALEGLDMAGELPSNLIVVVNDNQMSIAENHGGIYENLALLRRTNGTASENLFRAMHLDYLYVPQGNDTAALVEAFRRVKDTRRPVVVHINTLKGKGYAPAVADKEEWHFQAPFDIATGRLLHAPSGEDYTSLTSDFLLREAEQDESVAVIVAGTPSCLGMTEERRRRLGRQFIDVGIAEETGVALASGMAKRGAKPVFGVFSTFLQRTYDQLSQDLCINESPATILVQWGSLTAMNDVTHECFFDIPLLRSIPNLVYLAPTTAEEYLAMTHWAIHQTHCPVAVRIPCGAVRHSDETLPTDFSLPARSQVLQTGSRIAILALGTFRALGEQAARILEERHGIRPTLINPRYISHLDTDLLDTLHREHSLVITLEDGIVAGGFGESVAAHFGSTPMRTLCFGAEKKFVDRFRPTDFLAANRLTPELIAEDALSALG